MSLLTRCPACTTLYRVVPDQLRISEGWVKCGQCGEIFDASQHLIEAIIDPEPPAGATVEPLPAADSRSIDALADDFLTATAAESDADKSVALPVFEPSPDTAWPPKSDMPGEVGIEVDWSCGLGDGTQPEQVPDVATPLTEVASSADSDWVPAPGFVVEQQSEPHQVRWDDEPEPDSTSNRSAGHSGHDDAPVTFMQVDTRAAFWRKPLVRGVLAFVCLTFGLTLVGQWVYLERDRLAAQQPEMKSMLQAFCRLVGCEVQSLKRIEALSVDSVGFHQLGQGTYRLTFTVKNSFTLPLAVPYVELALTDVQDRVVYRRIFSSKVLGFSGAEISAGADWPATVALRVNSDALAERVFGYRLLVFYP